MLQITQKSKEISRNYLINHCELNENENIIHQNLWDAVRAVILEIYSLNAHVLEKKKSIKSMI